MDNHQYAAILDAVPKTGVYVIREADHALLYLNKRARELSPDARVGKTCPGRVTGSCGICLLASMENKTESHAVSFDSRCGDMMDLTATRILWEDTEPAFIVTTTPHSDSASFTYRKILHADLWEDRCNVLQFAPKEWRPGVGTLSRLFAGLIEDGAIHPQDVERFAAFTQLEHLRRAAQSGQDALSLIYRRSFSDGAYRWNLMEVFPWPDSGGRYAVICVKDVHDMMQEGLERMGLSLRGQDLIRSLGEKNFNIYTIDLNSGAANPIRVDGVMQEDLDSASWDDLMRGHIRHRLLPSYQEEFERRFSLAGLRGAREGGRQKSELLCQWRSGEAYRYVSVTAYFGEGSNYTVLALQDVDEWMRRELAHTKRDMQMAAILKSRFQMMNTVYLDTGLCERINLSQSGDADAPLVGDYASYIENALTHFVHPEDAAAFRAVLSLEHLRQKAESIQDSGDEVLQYRLRGREERWIELHILYSRQKDHVMVNILGQDVTKAKQQEEAHLRALDDRAYMITSLSSLFFSTYYIDLERDTFRAVTQQKPVSRLLGAEVNFTTALQLYANQFIHPDDREAYIRAMSVENLRENLRWWQPYVSLEYRKLPDFPRSDGGACQRVRATAVLSRVGSDDLPKTAVYVARNISEDEHTDLNGI